MKTRIGMLIGALVALTVLSLGFASAEEQQPRPPQPRQEQQQPPPPPNDPVGEALFPPELVMQHQRELGLTDEQKTFMRSEIQSTTTRFNELQWQLQDAVEALGASMKESSVNEQQALAQLDKVLDAEREIKRLHIGLAIRIKNKLTPDQQEKLQTMKRHEGGPGRGPGGPGGPGRGPGGPGGQGGPGGPGRPGGPGGPPPGGPGRPGDEQPPPEPPTP